MDLPGIVLVVGGYHLRAIDVDGNDLWNYWLTFDNVKFRFAYELDDGSYLVVGNEQISLPGLPVTNGDLVAARTLSGGQLYEGQIQGIVRVEPDNNCVVVFNDPKFPNFKIIAQGANHAGAVTTTNGAFILPANFDDYVVSLVPPSPFWEVCENDVAVTLNAANPVEHLPFLVHAGSECPYPEVSLGANRLRRCATNQYYFSVRNFGSDSLSSAELLLTLDSLMTFEATSWNIISQNGGELRLSVPPIPPFGWAAGYVRFDLSCDALPGQEHCLSAGLQQLPPCLNNYLPFETMECRPNTSSFDPNGLTAFADGMFTDDKIFDGQSLEYLIHFQNTGTDTAFRVVIEDLLPEELDLASIQAGASSHSYETRLEGRLLRFIFDDIVLPDSSTNLEGSQGFVKFEINLFDDLTLGAVISNEANIFFDFNAPITTNEVVLTLSELVGSKEVSRNERLLVYPNPFSNSFTLHLPNAVGEYAVEIRNILGKVVYSKYGFDRETIIDSGHFSPGIYEISVTKEGKMIGSVKVVAW